MNWIKRMWFALLMLFCIQCVDAQIGLHIFKNDTTPASVILGNSFSFNAIIRNDSNSVFSDNISLGYSINGGASIFVSDSFSGLQFDTVSAILNPGDSVLDGIVVHVSGPQFLVGPSVVVIWPIATGGKALDSLILHINVLNPAGISDVDEGSIKAYIINNVLMIQSDPEIQLKQVRIFDVSGREVFNQINPSDNIVLPQIETGVYLTEITYNNNQRKLFKFFK